MPKSPVNILKNIGYKNILSLYLTKNLFIAFLAIFSIIMLIIFGNSLATILKSSVVHGMNISDTLLLVIVESIRNMPIVITLSIFIANIVAFGKLYKESEIVAINASGVGELDMFKNILPFIIFIALITTFIIVFLVPNSQVIKQNIITKNNNIKNFHLIKKGEFQKLANGTIVLYAKGNEKNNSLGELFIYNETKNKQKNIIVAKDGSRHQDNLGNTYLRLKNGVNYKGFFADSNKQIANFRQYDIKINDKSAGRMVSKSAVKDVSELLSSNKLEDIAEWQWRFSLPISIIIMAALGILLSKTLARGGKNLGVLWGVIIFAIYLNMLETQKNSIEDATISPIFGMLWVHLLFIFVTILFYLYRNNYFKKIK